MVQRGLATQRHGSSSSISAMFGNLGISGNPDPPITRDHSIFLSPTREHSDTTGALSLSTCHRER